MIAQQLATAYKTFFAESDAGQHFVDEMSRQIKDNHEKAEENPELCRDYVQRAKGCRDVLEHIDVVMAGIKKSKPISK